MKSLTRTIIVLVIFNLTMGNFALAQNTPDERAAEDSQPTVRPGIPGPVPTKSEPTEPAALPGESAARRRAPWSEPRQTGPAPPMPAPVVPAPSEAQLAPRYPTRARRLSPISGRKILVIPATDVEAENLVEITQDLQVMSHIIDERFKRPRTIEGVFVDFGAFFGRDSRETEAIYLQGYGALFLMEVNVAFSPPAKAQEQEPEDTAEYVDPDWQRAKQKLFSPTKGGMPGMGGLAEQESGLLKIEELKTELIKTLKHAANIRNLKADEWVILTVIGQDRQPSGFDEYFYRYTAPSPGTSTSRRRPSSSRRGGSYGGYGAAGGSASYSRGKSSGGGGGFSRGAAVDIGGMDRDIYAEEMEYMEYGEMGPPSATVLTIRAKKSDVDAFAKGELDFEQFQQNIKMFTY